MSSLKNKIETTNESEHNFLIFYVKSYKYFLKINQKWSSDRIT